MNLADKPLIFIEVQTGTYFDEDDIVRLEDEYDKTEYVKNNLFFYK
jgi:mannose-6-phosphate isomerase